MSFKSFRIYSRALLFLIILPASLGLRNVSIIVPEAAERGKPVVLKCLYDLQNEDLYQVKWYKREMEFCRYTPMEVPPLEIFPIPGIEVDREGTDATQLTISSATKEAQGRYTCEISVDAPSSTTVQLHGFMYVVDKPKYQYPDLISAYHICYRPGMRLKAECICHESMPPANLSFYIHDKPALSEHVWRRVIGDKNGLWTAHSLLEFVVQKHHIIDSRIKVRCTASIYSIYHQSFEISRSAEIISTTLAPVTRAQVTTACPKHRVLENSGSWNQKILWAKYLITITSIVYGQYSLGYIN